MAGLHEVEAGLEPGDWWACSEPERPADTRTIYEERCPACRLKAQVEVIVNGDRLLYDCEDEAQRSWLSDLAAGRMSWSGP